MLTVSVNVKPNGDRLILDLRGSPNLGSGRVMRCLVLRLSSENSLSTDAQTNEVLETSSDRNAELHGGCKRQGPIDCRDCGRHWATCY